MMIVVELISVGPCESKSTFDVVRMRDLLFGFPEPQCKLATQLAHRAFLLLFAGEA
jgi:hypothetical protein